MTIPPLRTTLWLNAAFSSASGLAAMAIAAVSDRPFGLHPWVLGAVGAGLIAYAIQLGLATRTDRGTVTVARFAIIADAAWVVGAVILLALFPTVLSVTGRVLLAALSLVVADLAVMQHIGVRRLRRPSMSGVAAS